VVPGVSRAPAPHGAPAPRGGPEPPANAPAAAPAGRQSERLHGGLKQGAEGAPASPR
jgi:hypothetical protein